MIILDGKSISHHLIESYKTDIDVLKEKNVIPCLCVILIGDNPESTLYVKMKKKEFEKLIDSIVQEKYTTKHIKYKHKEKKNNKIPENNPSKLNPIP